MLKFKSLDARFTESSVKLMIPLSKIDEQRRQVSGFATLDNEDTSADIVTADASAEAFSKFRGNIREMHQPIAAGKLVDFTMKKYIDPDTGNAYNGVYVTAYISKGAEATWQKVLDGTLSGFSIHGGIEEAHSDISKATGESIRIITKYSLDELSLVDNPCNQFANVFSIEKSAGGSKATGVSSIKIENIFFCPDDDVAKCSEEESEVCEVCEKQMKNIAWVESSEDNAAIAKAISDYKNGGETVEKKVETEEAVVETATPTKTEENPGVGQAEAKATVEEAANVDETEEAADNDETATEEPTNDLDKVLSEIRNSLDEVAKSANTNVGRLEKALADAQETFEKKLSELADKHEALTKRIEDAGDSIGKVEKRLQSVEAGTAIKKSGELDDKEELSKAKSEESLWGGIFLNVNDV